MSEKNQNLVWDKFLQYLKGLEPRIYISKSVRILAQEALKADPSNERLLAVNEFIELVARPEPASKSSKFTF